MNRKIWIGLFTVLLIALPFSALAGDQKMQGMDHGKMKGMEQGGMMNGMMMLGNQTENGVKAMAHIKDIHEGMAKMGMDQTHHLMVMFTDAATGKPIATGTVAVKIKDPAGKVSKPIQLMPMNMGEGEGFGSDIALPAKGKYQFLIGSKLEDGHKRQFQFNFDNQ